MSYSETVKNKDGKEKTVVAQTQSELVEAVKAVKAEKAPVSPDINKPSDGNKVGTTSPHKDEVVPDSPSVVVNPVNQDGTPKEQPKVPKPVPQVSTNITKKRKK